MHHNRIFNNERNIITMRRRPFAQPTDVCMVVASPLTVRHCYCCLHTHVHVLASMPCDDIDLRIHSTFSQVSHFFSVFPQRHSSQIVFSSSLKNRHFGHVNLVIWRIQNILQNNTVRNWNDSFRYTFTRGTIKLNRFCSAFVSFSPATRASVSIFRCDIGYVV